MYFFVFGGDKVASIEYHVQVLEVNLVLAQIGIHQKHRQMNGSFFRVESFAQLI